jgi:hypothetical protein
MEILNGYSGNFSIHNILCVRALIQSLTRILEQSSIFVGGDRLRRSFSRQVTLEVWKTYTRKNLSLFKRERERERDWSHIWDSTAGCNALI